MPLTIDLINETDGQIERAIRDARLREERSFTTLGDLAEKYGMNYATVAAICKGIEGPSSRKDLGHKDKQRTADMVAKYEAGGTLQSIGNEYSITRERVRQLLAPSAATKKRRFVAVLKHEEAIQIKYEIRAKYRQELNEKLQQGLAMVRAGSSILEATRTLDLPANLLSIVCKQAGIKSLHGRWRDNAAIEARVRQLRSLGLSWGAIIKECHDEGLAHISNSWIYSHLKDLVSGHKPDDAS